MTAIKKTASQLAKDLAVYFDLNEQKKQLEKAVKGYRDALVERIPEGDFEVGGYKASVIVRSSSVWDNEKLEALLGDKLADYRKTVDSKVLTVKKI